MWLKGGRVYILYTPHLFIEIFLILEEALPKYLNFILVLS
jgi:hypothetical protein